MPDIRTRFAPSPTGHLHIGGARTALFNYLYARRHGGAFVLRIEDTDRQRSEQRYVDAILESMAWLGLDYDEGPFYQSSRGDLYADVVKRLFEGDHCYYCYCTPEELEAKREQAQKQGRRAVYDRSCRALSRKPSAGETPVVRFRSPVEGLTAVNDLVRGRVVFDNKELDDLILLRSDGTPTFHLVVVADDIDMGITHILRGEDHLSNTPKQIQIFNALGARPPHYGHMPLIVGSDRARLSKRHGATSVQAYKEQGYLPAGVLNYLARLGWSHGDQEIFAPAELKELFDIADVGKAAAAFDMEKFTWVNFQHLKESTGEDLAKRVRPFLEDRGFEVGDEAYLARVVSLLRERAHSLVELAAGAEFFVTESLAYDAAASTKFLKAPSLDYLRELSALLADIESWNPETIEAAFGAVLEKHELKLGKLAQPVRVALSGGTVSPGIFEVCEVLGKQRTVERIDAACNGAESGTLPLRKPASD